jgi:AGZA family xanthine/uracil permease-like MFS transporter
MLTTLSRAKSAADINWRYIGDAVPAFLTIAIMPFTYSIAYGLIAGIISYIVLNTIVWIVEKISGNRIRPADKEYKDFWTYKIEGGLLPPWLLRASKGKKDFWRPYEDVEHNTDSHPAGMTLEGKEEHSMAGSKSAGENVRSGSSSEEGEKVKM